MTAWPLLEPLTCPSTSPLSSLALVDGSLSQRRVGSGLVRKPEMVTARSSSLTARGASAASVSIGWSIDSSSGLSDPSRSTTRSMCVTTPPAAALTILSASRMRSMVRPTGSPSALKVTPWLATTSSCVAMVVLAVGHAPTNGASGTAEPSRRSLGARTRPTASTGTPGSRRTSTRNQALGTASADCASRPGRSASRYGDPVWPLRATTTDERRASDGNSNSRV